MPFFRLLGALLTIPMFLGLQSCEAAYLYEQSYELPPEGWSYDNVLTYEFPIYDTTKAYQLLLEIEHSSDYAYQNCYVNIATTFPDGERSVQQLSLNLADNIGRWAGDCGGNSCTAVVDLQPAVRFPGVGTYTITLEQYMRINPVSDLQRIALLLKEATSTANGSVE